MHQYEKSIIKVNSKFQSKVWNAMKIIQLHVSDTRRSPIFYHLSSEKPSGLDRKKMRN